MENLRAVLEAFEEQQISTLLFLGDFCSPIPAKVMNDFDGTIHCVFGNGDGDRFALANIAHAPDSSLRLHGEHAALELDGIHVALTHYPFYAEALAKTGEYSAVFSGHTHERLQQHVGGCLWINPGDVLGLAGNPSYAIFDTVAVTVRILDLES